MNKPEQKKEKQKGERQPIPRWKKIAVLAAAGLILAGLGLGASGSTSPAGIEERSSPTGAQSLVANPSTGSRTGSSTEPSAEEKGLGKKISPFLIHGGISFFVGLAIGAAVRAFVKVALVIFGVIILGYVALSYSGAVGTIDWESAEKWLVVQMEKANETTTGLQNHLLLSLPSAGLAGAGLVTGFKRK